MYMAQELQVMIFQKDLLSDGFLMIKFLRSVLSKRFIGHTLGASEGIEAVYSVLSVYHGFIYPNLNFKEPIEENMLMPETSFREGLPIRNVLSNSFGFGGNDSSILFSTLKER